jgi:hypothetical protein
MCHWKGCEQEGTTALNRTQNNTYKTFYLSVHKNADGSKILTLPINRLNQKIYVKRCVKHFKVRLLQIPLAIKVKGTEGNLLHENELYKLLQFKVLFGTPTIMVMMMMMCNIFIIASNKRT